MFFSKKAGEYGFKYMIHPQALCDHIKKFRMLDIVKMFNNIRNDVLAEIQQNEKELVAHG